jgi:hypothetical protein
MFLRLLPWPPAAFRCVRCGDPIPFAEDAVCVSDWDAGRWIDDVAHEDREVCKQVLS